MGLISEATVAFVRGVAAEAERLGTPCGDGRMVWHIWGEGPPLVLLHGGYGSWSHWIRNVLPLSRSFTVAAPDLPGLGESATPPEPHTAEGLARIIVEGLDIVFPKHAGLHITGFSFGGVLGGHVAAQLGDRALGFTIVGSNGLGLVRQPTALERVPDRAAEGEVLAVARHNLRVLMIADRAKLSDVARTSSTVARSGSPVRSTTRRSTTSPLVTLSAFSSSGNAGGGLSRFGTASTTGMRGNLAAIIRRPSAVESVDNRTSIRIESSPVGGMRTSCALLISAIAAIAAESNPGISEARMTIGLIGITSFVAVNR